MIKNKLIVINKEILEHREILDINFNLKTLKEWKLQIIILVMETFKDIMIVVVIAKILWILILMRKKIQLLGILKGLYILVKLVILVLFKIKLLLKLLKKLNTQIDV